MAYEVEILDGGILRVAFTGHIEAEDMAGYSRAYEEMRDTAQDVDKIHFLVDVSEAGKGSAAARRAMTEWFRAPDPQAGKTAIVGANRYMRVLTSFVIKATGKKDMRLFDSAEDALVWLRGSD